MMVPKGRKVNRNKPRRLTDPAYLAHIRRQKCACCGIGGWNEAHHLLRGTKKGHGWGLKAGDDECLPLCGPFQSGCHTGSHQGDETGFLAMYGINDAPALAAEYRAEYLRREK